LGAGVVGLFAVVALDALGAVVAMVVDLCASVAVVVGMFYGVAIGFDGIDRANVVARIDFGAAGIDFGALSTHAVGRLEDLQLLRNFLNQKTPL